MIFRLKSRKNMVMFQTFLNIFFNFRRKFIEKPLKEEKRLNTVKKVFQPALRYAQHPKAGQNTQQL